jgi:aspartate/methionine/tyrosine aminotransferase
MHTTAAVPFKPELPLSAVATVAERAQAAGWKDALPMAGGEPRFDPPRAALSVLANQQPGMICAVTRYSPFRGRFGLLEGIQRKLATVNGVHAGLDELIVVPGGSAGLFAVLSVLITPRRRDVVITDPCWEHYPNIITAAGGRAVRLRTTIQDAHNELDLDEIAAMVTSRTAAVLLNSPLNPTGSMLSSAEIEAVGELCDRRATALIVDEEYETFSYGGRRHMSARAAHPTAISVFSFSKSFALTGIRLGYVAAPPPVIDALKRFALYTWMYPPSPSQVMAEALLTGELLVYLEQVRQAYERKASYLASALDNAPGVDCAMPEGGVYVFPRIADVEGTSLTSRLIEEQHLLCVPGEAAGETGIGHVRLFVGLEDELLDEAVERVQRCLNGRQSSAVAEALGT